MIDCALLHDTKVLLLDEPTVGPDALARQSITDQVHDLADAGLSIIPPDQTCITCETCIVPGLSAMILPFNDMQSSLGLV